MLHWECCIAGACQLASSFLDVLLKEAHALYGSRVRLAGQLRRKKQAKGDLWPHFFLQTCDHSCVFGWSLRNKDGETGRFAAWKPGVLKSKGVICCKDFWTSPDLTPNVFGQCFWYVFVESLLGLEMRSSQNSEMQILISSKWPIDDILLTSLDKSDFKMGGSKFWDLQAMIWQSM